MFSALEKTWTQAELKGRVREAPGLKRFKDSREGGSGKLQTRRQMREMPGSR